MKRFVVGLTGGIGSGKSAAAAEFERLGATVVDTDAIAHELTAPGGAAVADIRRIFGPEFVSESGALNREKMRALVFSNPARRKDLEFILHPMIRAETLRRTAAAAGPYVIQVVPLLAESPDYRRKVDRVLVVDAPEALQVARVRQRSALSDEEVRRIIASQIQRETRLAAADDVIDNSGTIAAMQQRVRELHEKYLQLGGAKP